MLNQKRRLRRIGIGGRNTSSSVMKERSPAVVHLPNLDLLQGDERCNHLVDEEAAVVCRIPLLPLLVPGHPNQWKVLQKRVTQCQNKTPSKYLAKSSYMQLKRSVPFLSALNSSQHLRSWQNRRLAQKFQAISSTRCRPSTKAAIAAMTLAPQLKVVFTVSCSGVGVVTEVGRVHRCLKTLDPIKVPSWRS